MKTLLLVEDGEVETFLVKRALERVGSPCLLQSVKDGDQAVEYLSGTGPYADRSLYPMPEAILLDLNMPGRNGLQVLQWIRDQPALVNLSVSVLTKSLEPSDVQEAYRLGAKAYLVKPGNMDGLEKILLNITQDWLSPGAHAE
jgi:CheY-like chemotaxis protein